MDLSMLSNTLYFIASFFFFNAMLFFLSVKIDFLYSRFEIRHLISLFFSFYFFYDNFFNSFVIFKIILSLYTLSLIGYFVINGFKSKNNF